MITSKLNVKLKALFSPTTTWFDFGLAIKSSFAIGFCVIFFASVDRF